MDLENYKKAWENQTEENQKVTKEEVYKMTKSKSSSIVKWIFIVGIIEFAFWLTLNAVFSNYEGLKVYEELNMMQYLNFLYYINFAVVVIFLYYFYKNYSSISTIDNTKSLMNKIIKTRKTVKYYVNFNVLATLFAVFLFNILIISTPNGIETMLAADNVKLDDTKNLMAIYIISQAIAVAIMILFLIGFYYLLYGIMLKKLKRNYKELAKLEDLN